MKVGYVSNLNVSHFKPLFDLKVQSLVKESKELKLDYLIICGGISNDYKVTLDFVNQLGIELEKRRSDIPVNKKVELKFIIGNTDLYHKELLFDKENTFNSIVNAFRKNRYYLPYNPILKHNIRIIGTETWYDYSLYRGKPKSLIDVCKKKLLWYKNKDNKYITNSYDYLQGKDNTFDCRYSNHCNTVLSSTLQNHNSRLGFDVHKKVVVMYFNTSTMFMSNSFINKYIGTFKGSTMYHKTMSRFGVTDCIFGVKSKISNLKLGNINYLGVSKNKKIKDIIKTKNKNMIKVVNYEE